MEMKALKRFKICGISDPTEKRFIPETENLRRTSVSPGSVVRILN
jgi:hypothetical protein